ncbi:MAG: hypothetical protein U0U46_07800 [Saprospiraceae bacterium]
MSFKIRICKNKTTDLLRNTFHATPLTPPESTIRPLFILSRHNGKIGRLGYLKELFDKDKQSGLSPKPATGIVADTALERTQKVDFNLGVNILGALVKGFNLDISPVKAALNGAREISFSFTNIQRLYIDQLKLGNALAGKQVNLSNSALKSYLRPKDKAQMLLVTDVLASNSLAVNVESEHSQDFKIQMSPIESFIADAKLDVKARQHQEKTIQFEGTESLTFAFSCVELEIDPVTGILSLGLPVGLESTRGSGEQEAMQPGYVDLDDDPAMPGFLELDH